MDLSNSRIAKYLGNTRLVILVLLLVILVGTSAFLSLPRNLNPEIKIPIVLVSTILPGANPSDVESLVTIPLEDQIAGLEKIKTYSSSSRDSASIINIEFESGVDADKARDDVKSAVDSVSLPDDALDPTVIKLDFENAPVWTFALTTKKDDASLFTFAKSLQTKLKDLPEIKEVNISGLEDTEVEITIKPEVLSAYRLNPLTISQLVTSSLKSFPAGVVKTSDSSFAVSIDQSIVSVDDIRKLKINVGGSVLTLSDIALVSLHPKPDQAQSFAVSKDQNLSRAVTFNIFKTSSVNIDKSVKASEKLIDQELEKTQHAFVVNTLTNTSEDIDTQFDELQRDFLITIILVVITLFIFLGARQALVSAASAPLTFMITFAVMQATGISLNFLSLFSLLLALGLLVDDTVVVISAMTAYYRTGKWSPLETAARVWQDFLIPVFTTTITTVWAFLPLLLSSGLIGEFIKSIPIVVSTALTASFLVSIFITLPLIVILLGQSIPRRVKILVSVLAALTIVGSFYAIIPKDNNIVLLQILAFLVFLFVLVQIRSSIFTRFSRLATPRAKAALDNGLIHFEKIDRRYKNLIERILISPANRRKTIIMVIIFSVFSFILLPIGFVKNEFFPASDENFLYLTLELPAGTYIDKTTTEAKAILSELKDTPEMRFATTDIGLGFDPNMGTTSAGGENALFTLVLNDKKKRDLTSGEIANLLRDKFASYTKGTLNVQEVSGGPPAGADLQIKLLGDDLNTLDTYADKVEDFVKNQQGTANAKKSIKPGTARLTFIPDKVALAQRSVSSSDLGQYLRMYASGFNIDKNKFPGDTTDKDITLRLSSTSISANSLSAIQIPTQTGSVPILSLGKFVLKPNPTLISREDGKRTISVTAAVTAGHNTADLNKQLETFADSDLNLPEGYAWKTGGVNEENNRSVQSILQAMLLSFFLIIVTMVVQFASFRRAIIVMLVIPLSISGVFIIFALTNTPLSFPALIGVLALFGIVVKNSILVVDKIVKNQNSGVDLVHSISDAAASRLEPIALTSFCTIVGLVPITLSDPLWRGLGGAIIAGLTFSGTIMLFFIPVVYYLLFKG